MTLEQLHSLTEDELSLLWFIVNKIGQPIVRYELDPPLFTSIEKQQLINRVLTAESSLSEEGKPIYESLKTKMGIECKVSEAVQTPPTNS
jgi:hypothetical protein